MISVIEADLANPMHQVGIVECIDAYARDEMGGGRPLSDELKGAMIAGLEQASSRLIWLAVSGSQIVGVAVCFRGFSTFSAKPRVNVHDLSVVPEFRGKGIGRLLLERVVTEAKARGSSGVTLEVRKDNEPARHLYRSVGFSDWMFPLEFWEKKL